MWIFDMSESALWGLAFFVYVISYTPRLLYNLYTVNASGKTPSKHLIEWVWIAGFAALLFTYIVFHEI